MLMIVVCFLFDSRLKRGKYLKDFPKIIFLFFISSAWRYVSLIWINIIYKYRISSHGVIRLLKCRNKLKLPFWSYLITNSFAMCCIWEEWHLLGMIGGWIGCIFPTRFYTFLNHSVCSMHNYLHMRRVCSST